ncbi:hypothetical protein EKO04_007677 [Ascochyta lentis]|uniref:Uncharacterized protein n=1 Tax=Ascochyta lentis TaxID=205686 RepID=A0A8H7J176_9PLEO|nr:hypothetical protein EKO04_007677 [Ascochyta lentis]
MSLSTRHPTLLRMVLNSDESTPQPPTTPSTPATPHDHAASPNTTELEPTPLLLALDMAAERKRLRRRTDSVVTGADAGEVEEGEGGDGEGGEEEGKEGEGEGSEDGKMVIVPVKEDLSQLALLGQSVGSVLWNGVEAARRGVWGLAGWK